MSTSEEQMKRTADLKLWIETRVSELQEEIDRLKEALAVVDGVLRGSSFRPALEVSASKREEESPAVQIPEMRELKRDKSGETIAIAQITSSKVVVEPVAELTLKVDTPPFKSFLLGKILAGMKTKDEELVANGRVRKGNEFRYSVGEKNGRITEVTIENYREKERLGEILNTLGWTFSRMLEK